MSDSSSNQQKHHISIRALRDRINRRLAPDSKQLRVSVSPEASAEMGKFFIVDLKLGCVASKNVDIGALAIELNVLKSWEAMPLPEDKGTVHDQD